MNAVQKAVAEQLPEKGKWLAKFTITKFANDADFAANEPFEVSETPENLLLNVGIGDIMDLLGAMASPTTYSNANAYLGVGDSSTTAVATQTQLQAATNLAYVAMDSTYPSRSAQTTTWQATFGSSTGNFAWNEFTISSGSTNTTGHKLNRLVSAQGTKASGQTWVLKLTVTLS